jgi:hypothetical protein
MGLILVVKITMVQNPPHTTDNTKYTRSGFSCNLGRVTITGNLKPVRHFIFNCTHLLSRQLFLQEFWRFGFHLAGAIHELPLPWACSDLGDRRSRVMMI